MDEANFSQRIYVYWHRIWEMYDKEVASLVILCDDKPNYRPNQYKSEIWGTKLCFEFPVIKLLDYSNDWDKLECSNNPFAIIVMAQLKAKLIKDGQQRKYWKFRLTKKLYEGGYSKADILELYRFLDWILTLSKEIEKEFDRELSEYEKEKEMQYVTSVERRSRQEGIQEGRQEGRQEGSMRSIREDIIEILDVRFSHVLNTIKSALDEIDDIAHLKELHREAITISSIDAFFVIVNKYHQGKT